MQGSGFEGAQSSSKLMLKHVSREEEKKARAREGFMDRCKMDCP